MDDHSVGLTETKFVDLHGPIVLDSGGVLTEVRVAYETYGKLNKDKSNAILICHALSGDAHAAGYHKDAAKHGWWDIAIGPGKGFDTDKHFIICSNILGGCKGTTGPASIDPATHRPYGTSFPVITIGDMVRVQKLLIEHFGIERLFAVAGGSMGGMQALQWAVQYPEAVKRAVVIASTACSTPQQIAFNAVGRRAIISDPAWMGGDYYGTGTPSQGLALARMVGHITYLSDDSMLRRFGRNLQGKEKVGYDFSTDFQVESYLYHKGDSFVSRFDPNSYLYITKAIDYFDLTKEGSLINGLAPARAKFLVVGISSDWLYPAYQSEEIVSALSANGLHVCHGEIRSNYGHDAFLIEGGQLNYLLKCFFNQVTSGDVMIPHPLTVPEGTSISEVSRQMVMTGLNHLPVVDGEGRISGIVTSWDIARAVAYEIDHLDLIVSRSVITTKVDEPLETVVNLMEENDVSALPVVDAEQRVVGLVTNDQLSPVIRRCPRNQTTERHASGISANYRQRGATCHAEVMAGANPH